MQCGKAYRVLTLNPDIYGNRYSIKMEFRGNTACPKENLWNTPAILCFMWTEREKERKKEKQCQCSDKMWDFLSIIKFC